MTRMFFFSWKSISRRVDAILAELRRKEALDNVLASADKKGRLYRYYKTPPKAVFSWPKTDLNMEYAMFLFQI